MEVPTGLEPMITELQSVALPTWPWNHSIVSSAPSLTGLPLYNIPDSKILQAFLTKKSSFSYHKLKNNDYILLFYKKNC